MTLYIDGTNFDSVSYFLVSGKKLVARKEYKIDSHQSHETLSKLDEFLKLSKAKKTDINSIVVNSGPGSYTGTRVGVTHAMALGFAWDIPIKTFAKEKFDLEIKKAT